MMLVLAILVAFAGITMISLTKMLPDQRLRQSANLIRADWAGARTKAMKSGAIYVFRYEVGGDRYSVSPWMADESLEVEASENALEEDADDAVAAPAEGTGPKLLEGVTFSGGDTAGSARDARVEESMQSSGGMQGRPVLFYPDGSTSDARLILGNTQERFMVIDLRGLTGVTQSSDVLASEELSP